jgi:MHS family proline/betaine transporter-like MFS transporter
MKLGETPAFANLSGEQHEGKETKAEFRSIFVKHWPKMVACVGLVLTYNVAYYMFSGFIPTYLSPDEPYVAHPLNTIDSNVIQIGVMAIMAVVVTFIGRLSDRVGRRPIIGIAAAALVVFSLPATLLIQADTHLTIFAGTLVMGLETILFAATMAATLPALFPTEIRQGGLSIAYNVSVSLFGGTVPFVMAWLIGATHDNKWPGYYLMAAGVVAAVTVLFVKESAGKPLEGSPPAVETEQEARELAAPQA